MKPIVLQGHERSITQIKYNTQGDLLFSCSKDHSPCVWYSDNGERLGTYTGQDRHKGTVWSLDVNWDSKKLFTGSADMSAKLWDVETGVCQSTYMSKTSVRSVDFSYCGNLIAYCSDAQMGHNPRIIIRDIRNDSDMEAVLDLEITKEQHGQLSKPMCVLWSNLDQHLITGHDDGTLCQWDIAGTLLHRQRLHQGQITHMELSKDGHKLITSSKDKYAKLSNPRTLGELKCYKTERPVNSAALSPTHKYVVLGGGQEARDVTTTSSKDGKFDARFYHMVFEDEFARVKGHFGPINSIQFHPNGQGFSSGGEDGFIRMHKFDKDFFKFQMEC